MEEKIDYVVVGGTQDHQAIKQDGICTTLTAAMGAGGGYVPLLITIERVDDGRKRLDNR